MIRASLGVAACAGLLMTPLACKSKEEILQAAENKGQLMAEKKARLIKGVGEGLEQEGKAASESLAKGSAQVIRGGVGGAVEGFSALPVALSETLAAAGIKAERAAINREGDPKTPQIKVYLVLDKPFKGDLTLLAKGGDGKEVGRSKVALDEQENGKYVMFDFDPLVDLSIAKGLELR